MCVVTRQQEQPKFDCRSQSWHKARGRRGTSTKRGRAGRPGAGKRRDEWVRTGYGNWVRWSPPPPRAVEASQGAAVEARSSMRTRAKCASRRKKTQKMEVAVVQLKRKVKALEAKCAELQQRVAAAEEDARCKAPSDVVAHKAEAVSVAAQHMACVMVDLIQEWAAREQELRKQVCEERDGHETCSERFDEWQYIMGKKYWRVRKLLEECEGYESDDDPDNPSLQDFHWSR